MTQMVRHEKRGAFDCLVLDSPANRNAMSIQLLDELVQGIAESASGPSRGLVLAHAGAVFCSGVDLRERRALGEPDDSHSQLLGQLLKQLWRYPKPVVTTVNGAVRGGGMGVLACSDFVLASAASTFAYSEAKVGVAPALVMAVTLPSVPLRPLLPWLLTGEVFDAGTAMSLGLVTTVVSAPEIASEAETLNALSGGAPEAQLAIKRLARSQQGVDIALAMSQMTTESAALFRSQEAREGMAAFAERRQPAWAATPATPPEV